MYKNKIKKDGKYDYQRKNFGDIKRYEMALFL